MNRDWKPGDSSVAIISWESASKRLGGTSLAFRVSRQYDESHWVSETFGEISDASVAKVRPLAVIDPDSRRDIERLRDWYDVEVISQNSDPDPRDVTPAQRANALQAALREFANPTPRIEEPTQRYAAVADRDGCEWVRLRMVSSTDDAVWGLMLAGGEVREWRAFSDITAVRVISPGVPS